MTNIIIVGSGIIGLSVAEYFSARPNQYQTTIISNHHPLSGSKAAAANLGLKGQLYARDPHFKIKIEAKKIYPTWLVYLLKQIKSTINFDDIYRSGMGIDHFSDTEGREKQLLRVLQPKNILQSKNLPLNAIVSQEPNQIIYQNEAWVDARALMKILLNVLEKRCVSFVQEHFSQLHFKKYSQQKNTIIIFCTGAWTKNLLTELEIPAPQKIESQERLTTGMTFFGDNVFENDDVRFVLQDKICHQKKEKMTFSGPKRRQCLSSLTEKITASQFLIQENGFSIEKEKIEHFLNFAKSPLENSPFLKENVQLEQIKGFRVGYGSSELLIEKVFFNTNIFSQAVVCSGAHKSGFLFAPVMGEKIESLFLKQKV